MKTRRAWGLAVVVAVMLLAGAGMGIQRTYEFSVIYGHGDWGFGYQELRGGFHTAGLGPVLVVWSRRSD
jgi:hypothetical protein